MSGIQFNKCAINMGKVLKMLEEIEPKINSSYDLVLQKEDLLVIAYICRVGKLDREEPIFCPKCKSENMDYKMSYIT